MQDLKTNPQRIISLLAGFANPQVPVTLTSRWNFSIPDANARTLAQKPDDVLRALNVFPILYYVAYRNTVPEDQQNLDPELIEMEKRLKLNMQGDLPYYEDLSSKPDVIEFNNRIIYSLLKKGNLMALEAPYELRAFPLSFDMAANKYILGEGFLSFFDTNDPKRLTVTDQSKRFYIPPALRDSIDAQLLAGYNMPIEFKIFLSFAANMVRQLTQFASGQPHLDLTGPHPVLTLPRQQAALATDRFRPAEGTLKERLLASTALPRSYAAQIAPGGIDLNSQNMRLIDLKRDGKGVPLPFAQQDMATLSHITGFEPQIREISPVTGPLPILSEFNALLKDRMALASNV
jgi:hypothetical protein